MSKFKELKNLLLIVVILTFIVGSMAGCVVKEKDTASNDTSQNQTQNADEKPATKDDTPAYMNATGFPIAKEKITLKLMGAKSPLHGEWKDMEVMKRMEKLTNISFEYDTPLATGYSEKKNLIFASGDYPDVFYQGAISIQDEETYGPQGVFLPLEGYIDKYAPHIKKILEENPNIKKAITASDGHIYSLPYIVRTKTMAANILYINMEWLANVEMNKPETVEQLYNVLKAFKEKDPNKNNQKDEIPLSYWKMEPAGAGNIPGILHPIFYAAFSGQAGGANFDLIGNKVVFNPVQPAFKEYLAYMRKLYSEELLDHEMFTQTMQQYIAKYKEGKMGISTISLSSVLQPGQDAPYELLPPLTSAINNKKVTADFPGVYTGTFVLTNKCKYPEAMVRWADVFFRTVDENVEGLCGLSNFLGILDYNWYFDDASRKTYTRESKVEGLNPVEYINKHVMPGGFGWVVTDAVPSADPLLLLKANESEKHYFPYMIPIYPNTVRFTQEQAERMNFLKNDINTYVEQMIAKFIIGEEPLDKWDNYVNTVKSMGLDELTKIMQDAYDKWNR
ncbi:MAG: extracellular solute-binding protein [Firmicutes bacterium]|nr:extracellular solute-binding protein [Bacillota bacterium]